MALSLKGPSTDTIDPEENAQPRATQEDHEAGSNMTSGIHEVYPDMIPVLLPRHLGKESAERIQVILSRALLKVLFPASGSPSTSSTIEAPSQPKGRFSGLLRHIAPEMSAAWGKLKDRRSEERAIKETRIRCEALARKMVQEMVEAENSGQKMLYFSKAKTSGSTDIDFSNQQVSDVLAFMQNEPIPYIPSTDPDEEEIGEILAWKALEPTGSLYEMTYRDKRGKAKLKRMMMPSEAYAASLTNKLGVVQAGLITATSRIIPGSIFLDGRLFYGFDAHQDVDQLMAIRTRMHEGRVRSLNCKPESMEDELPFGFRPSDERHADIFCGPSLDPKINQQVQQYIWVGKSVSAQLLENAVQEIRANEEFEGRQGIERVTAERFPQGMAVRFPPYFNTAYIRRFKIRLEDFYLDLE